MPAKPRVFIASSAKSRAYADAVSAEIDHVAEPILWDGAFSPTAATLEELTQVVACVDFAIFLLGPDDRKFSRRHPGKAARGNVIAEVFLFIGGLGRERVFYVTEARTNPVVLPSDLLGVTHLVITDRRDRHARLRVRRACSDIMEAMDRVGIRSAPQPALTSTTSLHTPLLSTAQTEDLVSVEVRSRLQNVIPPAAFLKDAERELLITGITAKNTLILLRRHLDDALSRGVAVGILILDSRSDDVDRLMLHELVDVRNNLDEVRTLLIERYATAYPELFQCRFFRHAPPFTAVMKDGNALVRNGPRSAENGGAVRVQPRAAHSSQQSGVVFTFKANPAHRSSAFQFFAQDLRAQWDRALLM